MTALHWAAFNNDSALVTYLLSLDGVKLEFNNEGYTPCDVAGFCRNKNVVRVLT